MAVTVLATVMMMAAYFLILYAGVGFIQDKRFFSSAPKENLAAIPDRKECFRGAHIVGWALAAAALILFAGALILAAWDGVRNDFRFWTFFARFIAMLYLLEIYDIFFRLGAAMPFGLLSALLSGTEGRCGAAYVRV